MMMLFTDVDEGDDDDDDVDDDVHNQFVFI